jgi:hypothetical protein
MQLCFLRMFTATNMPTMLPSCLPLDQLLSLQNGASPAVPGDGGKEGAKQWIAEWRKKQKA